MKRNFLEPKYKTILYHKAVSAIEALVTAEGSDTASRAYAEAMHDFLLDEFMRINKLKKSTGRTCYQRLLGKQRVNDYEKGMPPVHDHPSLWLSDGKPSLFLAQPYGISFTDMENIVSFCKDNGLTASVDAWPSFHFPHHVLSLKYRLDLGRKHHESGS